MATANTGDMITLVAAADQSAAQFLGIVIDATGKGAVAGSAGAAIAGVLQNNPAAGQPGNVKIIGETKAVAGGAITAGAKVAVDATGKFVTATTGNWIAGFAKTGAASGDTFTVVLLPMSVSA